MKKKLEKNVQFRLTHEQYEKLKALADSRGLSVAMQIRKIVKRSVSRTK